jgi:hypothetical protein
VNPPPKCVSFGGVQIFSFNPNEPSAPFDIDPSFTPAISVAVGGVLHQATAYTNCIIITSDWTAWVFLCGVLHLQCLAVFSAPWDHPWVVHAREHGPLTSAVWFPLDDLVRVSARLLFSPCTVLVQNCPVETLPPQWLALHRILWVSGSAVVPMPPDLPYQCTVTHRETGGVLDATWTFWSNCQFQRRLPKLPSSSLLQVICQTTHYAKNRTCPPPERRVQRGAKTVLWLPGGRVDCRGLLPLSQLAAVVLCPSEYASTGWVAR